MTTSNEASNFAYGIIEAKANELMDNSIQLAFDNGLIIKEIEDKGEEVAHTREVIESNQRYLEDLIGSIKFKNGLIENNNRLIDELDSLVSGLREQLENFSNTPTVKPVSAPNPKRVRTQFGELTPQQMNDTFDKYEILLKLRGTQRFEYIQFLRSKGYPESDTNISLSLGKCVGWLGNLVGQAKRRGMHIEDK